ncbi:MAG: fibronectin type III domain-containing protein [Solirubrobacteraceae bacterium]|nr:fibronectin type III domain-containing protein [Solirubrobacteraceae bacterium]
MRKSLLLTTIIVLAALPAAPALAAPGATTRPATTVTVNSAVLNGNVNPRGVATRVYFQYGPTTSFGSRTPDLPVGNGTTAIPVSAPLTGLSPNTRYYYRLVAVGGGTTRASRRNFRTRALPLVIPEPAKMQLARATIFSMARAIDILAPISRRATGNVSIELFADQFRHRWTAPVDSLNGRIRDRSLIPSGQAARGTGILTITYPGNARTRPQGVRLRAANERANLRAARPTIEAGHLRAQGTIASRARGVVRVQLQYYSAGTTTTLEKFAPISNGTWTLNAPLTAEEQIAITGRQGTVHSYILFTGYLPARMRGEMRSFEVLGEPGATPAPPPGPAPVPAA